MAGGESGTWTFLTNHTHVLVCLARDPKVRLREVAEMVGITERAVQRIVLDLEVAGVITRQRDGRRNVYQIERERRLRHPVEGHRSVGDLLDLVTPPPSESAAVRRATTAATRPPYGPRGGGYRQRGAAAGDRQ